MSEVTLMGLAKAGRTISIWFGIAIYILLWVISSGIYSDKNNESKLLENFSIFWAGIHFIAFLGFLIWSWTY